MSAARTEVFTIEKTLPSERLDTYLRSKFPAVSRGAIRRLIDEGHVRVNGRKVKPTHTPRAREQVEMHWPEARPARARRSPRCHRPASLPSQTDGGEPRKRARSADDLSHS